MQYILRLLIFGMIVQQISSTEHPRNSSVLLKRCLHGSCHNSKSLRGRNKSVGFFGIFNKHKQKKVKIVLVSSNCTCVPFYLCAGIVAKGSFEIIDLRTRRCAGQGNVCCYNPYVTEAPTTTTRQLPTIPPAPTTTTTTTTPAPINCYCIPAGLCPYPGQIDPRQSFCVVPGMVCCKTPAIQPSCFCRPLFLCQGTNFYQIDPRFQVGSPCGASTVMCCNKAAPVKLSGPPPVSSSNLVKNAGTPDACICVKSWLCSDQNIVVLDVLGALDPRFGYCLESDEVCCRIQKSAAIMAAEPEVEVFNPALVQTPYIINAPVPAPAPAPAPAPNPATCGIRGKAPANTNPASETTYFAEFPWIVTLLLRQPGTNDQQLCGGSMITTRAVLTAAHCLYNRPSGVLVARFGEWDVRFTNESLPYQDVNVNTISTHPQFDSVALYYDVAVLILDKAVNLAGNVRPICLPSQGMTFAAGTRCWASGWGRNAFGDKGKYQTTLKKVDLPIVDNNKCQQLLQTTRLGPFFNLHGTFICAGGELNKDTCQGDGGGPLVCSSANNQYIQAGIVSWGIGCGSSNVPAVYASVAQLRTWIDQQLANYGAN